MKSDAFNKAISRMAQERKDREWNPRPDDKGQDGTGGRNVLCGMIEKETGATKTETFPCHKPINNFKNAEVLWSCFGSRTRPEVTIAYFDWLIHKSPWASLGIVPSNLSEDFMFNQGFVFDNLDKTPGNLLHNFLIGTRLAAEWPRHITAWYELVTTHGINPTFAFAFLTCYWPINGDYSRSPFEKDQLSVLNWMDKYDWPVDMARCNEEYLRNFVNGKTVNVNPQFFYPNAITAPVNHLWGTQLDLASPSRYLATLKDLYEEKYSKLGETILNTLTYKREIRGQYTQEVLLHIIKLEEQRLGFKEAV